MSLVKLGCHSFVVFIKIGGLADVIHQVVTGFLSCHAHKVCSAQSRWLYDLPFEMLSGLEVTVLRFNQPASALLGSDVVVS